MTLSSVEFFREQRKWAQRRTLALRLFSVAGLVGALMAATGVLVYSNNVRRADSERNQAMVLKRDLDLLASQIDQQKHLAVQIAAQSQAGLIASQKASQGQAAASLLADQIGQLSAKQDSVNKRMDALEGALISTPEKALAVPLLHQQLTDLQDSEHGDVASLRAEIGSVQTTANWALGLLITVIFSLASFQGARLIRRPTVPDVQKAEE